MEQERDVEAYLRRLVEQAGGRCVKFSPDYARGWPDRLVLLPGGSVCWVELKRPRGGVLAPAQVVAHEELRRLGQWVCVVRTKQEADALVHVLTEGKVDV